MPLPGFGFFRLDKEQEARHLALARAAIALGRKVLADNARPKIPWIAPCEIKKRSLEADRLRIAVESRAKAHRERKSLERQHLSIANEHVARAERVIRGQTAIIENLRNDGHDTRLAEETMRVFEANLQAIREHRELILKAIEEISDGR
jgi:hypothetical protein